MDPFLLEKWITSRTRAILPVHIYGQPVDMDPVLAIARQYNLYVVEDAAEGHGATYKGKKTGSLSDLACFSFYANKIVTTGEGGMITTNDPALAERVRLLQGLAYGPGSNRFMHQDIGFNYRFPNLLAAVGCAQLENIEQVIAGKRRLAARYNRYFAAAPEIQCPVEKPYARNVYWMYHIVLRGAAAGKRRNVMGRLRERGIDTREAFVPYNAQQIFIDRGWTKISDCPVATRIGASGLYLPSSYDLPDEDIEYVAQNLLEVLNELRPA
jgi:perosamine synthetase